MLVKKDFRMKLTAAQKNAIYRKWSQNDQDMSYSEFLATVGPGIGDDCVLVLWSGMWLGVETDGYCHS